MKIGLIFEAEERLNNQIMTELDSIINKYESMGMACWIYLKGNEAIEQKCQMAYHGRLGLI